MMVSLIAPVKWMRNVARKSLQKMFSKDPGKRTPPSRGKIKLSFTIFFFFLYRNIIFHLI